MLVLMGHDKSTDPPDPEKSLNKHAGDARHVPSPDRGDTSAAPRTPASKDRAPTRLRDASGDPPSQQRKNSIWDHIIEAAEIINRTPFKAPAHGKTDALSGNMSQMTARSSHLSTLKSTCWFYPDAASSINSHTRMNKTSLIPCRKQLVSTFIYSASGRLFKELF